MERHPFWSGGGLVLFMFIQSLKFQCAAIQWVLILLNGKEILQFLMQSQILMHPISSIQSKWNPFHYQWLEVVSSCEGCTTAQLISFSHPYLNLSLLFPLLYPSLCSSITCPPFSNTHLYPSETPSLSHTQDSVPLKRQRARPFILEMTFFPYSALFRFCSLSDSPPLICLWCGASGCHMWPGFRPPQIRLSHLVAAFWVNVWRHCQMESLT